MLTCIQNILNEYVKNVEISTKMLIEHLKMLSKRSDNVERVYTKCGSLIKKMFLTYTKM